MYFLTGLEARSPWWRCHGSLWRGLSPWRVPSHSMCSHGLCLQYAWAGGGCGGENALLSLHIRTLTLWDQGCISMVSFNFNYSLEAPSSNTAMLGVRASTWGHKHGVHNRQEQLMVYIMFWYISAFNIWKLLFLNRSRCSEKMVLKYSLQIFFWQFSHCLCPPPFQSGQARGCPYQQCTLGLTLCVFWGWDITDGAASLLWAGALGLELWATPGLSCVWWGHHTVRKSVHLERPACRHPVSLPWSSQPRY